MKTLLAVTAVASAAFLASACGKSDQVDMKPRANAPAQLQRPTVETRDDNDDANEALKQRLARQEAAAKLFDRAKPEAKPESKPEPVAARSEPAPARAAPAPARSEAAPQRQPEPVRTAAAAPAPAPAMAAEAAPAKTAEPARAEPNPEPVRLASAAPTTIPAAPNFAAKLVSRVDPEFPREAVQSGADRGTVKARMTLDGNGYVTRVEVVEATPRRVFDRAVVRALSQWRFSDGPSGRTVETEVEFKLR